MTSTHTTVEWRATHVPRVPGHRKLLRLHTTYKKAKNGNILWNTAECYESAGIVIPVDELHLVIAELAAALNAEREDAS